jgi:hypothetical protein
MLVFCDNASVAQGYSAFLAPDIVKGTVDETLPGGFGVSRLMDVPASWAEQRRATGLSARPKKLDWDQGLS